MTPYYQPHSGGHGGEHPPHGPYWKRMHHSPFFWVAVVCIMLAMTIYVLSNNLTVAPDAKTTKPISALTP